MPRCTHCGKVNREGSLFCQDCGHRIEPSTAAPAPAAKPPAASGTTCSACGTQNPPGMNFCKMCGASLAPKPAAAPAPEPAAPQAAKAICPACGKGTPVGFAFCQHCGQKLGQTPGSAPARSSTPQSSPVVAPPPQVVSSAPPPPAVNPTPPAGLPRHAPRGNGEAFAATIAPTPANMELFQQARAAAPAPAPAPVAAPAPLPAAVIHGLLVTVNRDGSDGSTVEISSETFDIGRTEGSLNFKDDPYLAARHVRLSAHNGKVVVQGLDRVNGVFIKVQGFVELGPGDSFLVGKELLRFEPVPPEERDPAAVVEHGVRVFGSVPREAWGRLRQLTVAATTRDVWHLTRPELVLGREEGDVTFPDDEFMSRRHATVKRVGSKTRLEDLNSSNGTFVRVRGERELKPGDLLRVGDQLLRFEVA